jgi:carbonic anhydrase
VFDKEMVTFIGRDLMDLEKNIKVLLVMGMEQELAEGYVERISHILPGELIILKSNELARIEPFGDLMRDILIYVYQNNIEEILIVDPKEDRKNMGNVLGEIEKNIDLQKNIRILDYLFTYCDSEFPVKTIKEWFEGNHILVNEIQDIIDVIRRHPLMPPSVKVIVLK